MTSQTEVTRKNLRAAFKLATANFSTDAKETAEVLKLSAPAVATKLFRILEARNFAASTHVNGERSLTWQTYFNVTDGQATMKEALAAFDKEFPRDWTPSANGRVGATGPRYEEAQIALGIKLTFEGKTAKQAASEVGVKSPSYFRKLCKARIAEAEAAKKSAAKKPAKKRSTKKAPVAA